ncbi:CHAT domain-containing tetratricopeptide repeat protein [Accumulibacter sp.]|uniref:CHAT domain-containing protein n=1 Tax=Accumulibacter sp. TaxID=2053492 RepID=UPI0028786893|nr:CHAT domain-containing tetratricopeptide repeat protein [Accumulibacter sp.]MDS4056358.1 CHAT domain-containing tetratricopeptide repeat protein [Accumulibacter sp.]
MDEHTQRQIDAGLAKVAALYRAGRPAEAIPFAELLCELCTTVLGADHPDTATSLNNLAMLHYALGDYARAEPVLQRALAISERVLGADHPDTATSLNNLALLYNSLGDYGRAEPLYQRALAISEQVLGADHPATAKSLSSLAMLYHALGDYGRAEPLLQRSLAIHEQVLGAEHPDAATSLNNLAALYHALGDYARAEPLFQRALAICERVLGADHPNTAVSLNNLAEVYRALGDYGRAEPLHQRALVVTEQAFGADHPGTAKILNNLAELYVQMGDYRRAEPLCLRALAIRERVLVADHPDTATSLNSLAMLYHARGDCSRAEPLLQRALTINEQVLGADHPHTAWNLFLVANHAAQDRPREALTAILAAAGAEDRMIGKLFGFASEDQRNRYLAQLRGTGALMLSLLLRDFAAAPEALRAGLDYVLRRKALSAEAAAIQQRTLLEGRYPQQRGRLQQLRLLCGQIARKIMTGPGPKETPKAHRQTLAAWEGERDALQAGLARAIPEIRLEQQLAAVEAGAVAARLGGNGVLVEFVRFPRFDFHAVPAKGGKPWTGERYLAFVLLADAGEPVRLVDLGEAALIDAKIQEFLGTLTGERSDPYKGLGFSEDLARPAPTAAADRPLRAIIFDPLLAALGGCRTLILCPDGELNRLPFEALTTPEGGCLIDHYTIRYVTSGRDLVRLAETELLGGADPLVLADPAFDLGGRPAHTGAPKGGVMGALLGWLGHRTRVADGEPAPGRGGAVPPAPEAAWLGRCSRDLARGEIHFDPLPGSREEGQNLGQRLGALPLIGESALEGRLKKQRSPAIVHLATHGFFLKNQPWKPPAFGLSGEMGVMGRLAGHENPMLRSGLALAGANTFLRERRSVSDEMEDGLLTAEDVAGIDLLNTELVFLSACETGLGDVQVGEGVFGLRRAFVIAGARTLIMTLWRVSDLATAILVDRFYALVLDDMPKGKALRQAQHDLRTGELGKLRPRWLSEPMRERLAAGHANRRRKLDELAAMPDDFRPFTHPYYWAAFILQGDDGVLRWRPRVPATKGTAGA